MEKNNQTLVTATLPSLEKYKETKAGELQIRVNNLVTEFKERKNELTKRSEAFTKEFELVAVMTYINSGKGKPEHIVKIEEMISEKWLSLALTDWLKEIGFNKMLVFMCEIMTYFFSSFKTKERTEGLELMTLAAKIYAGDKQMTIYDLIKILDNARKGVYGISYNRVDEETFFKWQKLYKDGQSVEIETEMINNKPEPSNVAQLVDPVMKSLAIYEKVQKQKKEIRDKVNSKT